MIFSCMAMHAQATPPSRVIPRDLLLTTVITVLSCGHALGTNSWGRRRKRARMTKVAASRMFGRGVKNTLQPFTIAAHKMSR